MELDDRQGAPLRIRVETAGAQYPITIDPWIQVAKLTASDGVADDDFGFSVAIEGDTIVVSARRDDSYRGSAYVFVKPAGGWSDLTQTAKLTASDGAASDQFGYSVAISGDTIVVGASGDDSSRGSAYVFVRPAGGWSNMTQTAKLTASDRAAGDYFGPSVAISGNTLLVGALGDDAFRGSAYVFVKPAGGWSDMTQSAKLTASDGAAGDNFGHSVASSGNIMLVGAHRDNSSRGSAYVFVKPAGGWINMTQAAKLTISDGEANDFFGRSVTIQGDTVVVGANGDDSFRGSAYMFTSGFAYVDPAGICGGNLPCHTSLQSGINAALPGDTVIAYPGFYNESVTLSSNVTVTLSGAMFYLNGSLAQSAGIFNAPATTLYLTGNLSHTGGTFNHNNGVFVFAGSGMQTVTGNVTFFKLTVNNGAIMDTGENAISVLNLFSNLGVVRASRSVGGVGDYTFGLAGLVNGVDLAVYVNGTGGCLSYLTVDRVDSHHPHTTSGIRTHYYWTITPAGCPTGGYNVNLTLPADFTPDANDKVCRYDGPAAPGSHWSCVQDARTASSITRNNVTELSDWAIGNNVGPTAVVLNGLKARSPLARLDIVVVLAGLVLSFALIEGCRLRSRRCFGPAGRAEL